MVRTAQQRVEGSSTSPDLTLGLGDRRVARHVVTHSTSVVSGGLNDDNNQKTN